MALLNHCLYAAIKAIGMDVMAPLVAMCMSILRKGAYKRCRIFTKHYSAHFCLFPTNKWEEKAEDIDPDLNLVFEEATISTSETECLEAGDCKRVPKRIPPKAT